MANQPQAMAELIRMMGRLPGLGPRSARRAVLHLLKNRETLMGPMITAMKTVEAGIKACDLCGALDEQSPCQICASSNRDHTRICVVRDMGDLWALERAGAHKGRYHVLGGLLSALDGIGPDKLRIDPLLRRLDGVTEVILALPASVEGQTTAHYLAERLTTAQVPTITRLAYGAPVGGDIEFLDDGTLAIALKSRQAV